MNAHHPEPANPRWFVRPHPDYRTKVEQTGAIADEFCKALKRRQSRDVKLIAVEERDIDATISIDNRVVNVELVGYTTPDKNQLSQGGERVAREQIATALEARGLVSHSIRLKWKTIVQGDREVFAVPQRKDREPFVADLCDAVELLSKQNVDQATYHFRPRETVDRWNGRPNGYRMIAAEDYPALSQSLESINLYRLPPDINPTLNSNIDSGFVALDRKQLAEIVQTKIDKAATYLARSPNTPWWLVVHIDMTPLSRRLPDPHINEAVTLVRSLIQQNSGCFEKVWLAVGTGFVDATELFEVH